VLGASDRAVISDAVTRADTMATQRDADGYAALFTDDAVLEGSEGVHEGIDSLRRDVGAIWAAEGVVSVHLTLNVDVAEVDGRSDQARATSVLVILGGDHATEIRTVAFVEQDLVRDEGAWRISRRSVRLAGESTSVEGATPV
jgi:ketosteroid isomerase-like protein